jgi:NDP-sugar pyrophosphorylase family protein
MIIDHLPEHDLPMDGDALTDHDYVDLLSSYIDLDAHVSAPTSERAYRSGLNALEVGGGHRITARTESPAHQRTVSKCEYALSKCHVERDTPISPSGFEEMMCDPVNREEHLSGYELGGFWLDGGHLEDADYANKGLTFPVQESLLGRL